MYGQMTAGSWIYIGSQGIVQGTYETFAEAGRQHYGGSWAGRWILTAGLGGMGGAQPLAATLRRRGVAHRRVPADRASTSACAPATSTSRRANLDDALALVAQHCARKEAVSIGLLGNAAEVLPELVRARQRRRRSSPTSSPTRPRRTTWSTATCRSAGRSSSGRPRSAITAMHARADRRPRRSPARPRAGDARLPRDGHPRGRLRQQHPPGRVRSRREERLRLSRASCRRTSGRCSARARGRSAGSRCPATPRTSTRPTRRSRHCSRRTRTCTAGSTWRASASPSRACRRASAGWAWASGTSPAWPSTRWCAAAS